MAEGALARSGAQMAISVTGVAGPGGTEAKPEGLVWFGLAQQGHPATTFERRFGPIGRAQVRRNTVEAALRALLDAIAPV
jgi:nicotinamide-nucleotide amidase